MASTIPNNSNYLEGIIASNSAAVSQGAIPRSQRRFYNNRGDNNVKEKTKIQLGVKERFKSEDRSKNSGARRCFPPGFKYIESLCEKDPEEIMISISSTKGFSIRLEQELSGDFIVILLKLLSKLCTSTFNECKSEVIGLFCQNRFIEKLSYFVATLPVQEDRDKRANSYFWQNTTEFWNNLHVMCNSVIDLMPNLAVDVIYKLVKTTILCIKNFESFQPNNKVNGEIEEKFNELLKRINLWVEELEKKKVVAEKKGCDDTEDELTPPNDFRELSVYPTSEEILSEERSFLRKNKTNCKYNSVEEYLDIQFRLLKEDFVGPLREGIQEYRNRQNKLKKNYNVIIHQKIQFMGSQNVKDQVGYKVKFEFDLKKLSKRLARLENSKRFMYGALVCFTNDNFLSLIFGKIIDRSVSMLEKGMIVVNFDNDTNIQFGVDYVMIECNIYFEPYYQVLKALQAMDVNNFPLERYIINIDPTIRLPSYLTESTKYEIGNFDEVELTKPLSWPTAETLQLNDSQYAAFRAGLTNEFCIIQGPPGNTFILNR